MIVFYRAGLDASVPHRATPPQTCLVTHGGLADLELGFRVWDLWFRHDDA